MEIFLIIFGMTDLRRTPFNGASANPFLLNQFGAGAGGPILKNKFFFYANYEGLRQRLDGTQSGLVPSPTFRQQAALTSPARRHLGGISGGYVAHL